MVNLGLRGNKKMHGLKYARIQSLHLRRSNCILSDDHVGVRECLLCFLQIFIDGCILFCGFVGKEEYS